MKLESHIRLCARDIRAKERHFPWFLLAALLPIVLSPIANLDGTPLQRLVMPLSVTILVLESLRSMPAWVGQCYGLSLNGIYRILGVWSAISIWWPALVAHHPQFALHALIIFSLAAYYLLTAARIIQVLAHSDRVSIRTLCLGAAGYVHLGLTAGLMATMLQLISPSSFNLGSMALHEELVSRLTYFSFVTLVSLGYGDVVPASPTGESFAVLLSISSTLYQSLLIGLLLSRFIASKERDLSEQIEDER